MIRVNSQSGKGGVAYVMKTEHQLDLPRRLQIEFSRVVQGSPTPRAARSARDDVVTRSRRSTWSEHAAGAVRGTGCPTTAEGHDGSPRRCEVEGDEHEITGNGNGPIAAFVDALATVGFDVRVLDYTEHALTAGDDARAAAYVECAIGGSGALGRRGGLSIVTASLRAVVSAVNRFGR